MSAAFRAFPLRTGVLARVDEPSLPSSLSAWTGDPLVLHEQATHFGFVADGPATLRWAQGSFSLVAGMYFSLPGRGLVEGGSGVVASRHGYRGLFGVGGPLEDRGRLRYIDGCSDTVLVPPVVWGDPCLNHLSIPPRINQTAHTHPSHRMGIVVRGAGSCQTDATNVSLRPGLAWIIPANVVHSFHTTDSELVIVAYHPDSDFGPTDQDHPMLNRTLIDGTSAAHTNRLAQEGI